MIAKVKVRQVDTPEQNRALGVVCGRYLPAADELATGVILLTSDNTLLPAVLLEDPLKKFENNPTLLNDEQYESAPIQLGRKNLLTYASELFRLRLASSKKRKSRRGRDLFDIRGYISKVQKRKRLITVRVYRNEAANVKQIKAKTRFSLLGRS